MVKFLLCRKDCVVELNMFRYVVVQDMKCMVVLIGKVGVEVMECGREPACHHYCPICHSGFNIQTPTNTINPTYF